MKEYWRSLMFLIDTFVYPIRLLIWSPVTWIVRDTINGTACEIEYFDRLGNPIGYWAYGEFDPGMPYKG